MMEQPTYFASPIPAAPPQGFAVPQPQAPTAAEDFDFTYVHTPARIAVYDDFISEPRVIIIPPAPTTDFIGSLAATVYQQAQMAGGTIAYSIILQVTENFIHARFSEMIVSIYNHGKTIRFSDQGPGIKNKEMALLPGFSSATQAMKHYIKGVGSGLPTVKEWLHLAHGGGKLTIDDNLEGGAVVTLSIGDEPEIPPIAPKKQASFHIPPMTDKERNYLLLMYKEGPMRITDFVEFTGLGKGTVSAGLTKLQEYQLVDNEPGTKRRQLTDLGKKTAEEILNNLDD